MIGEQIANFRIVEKLGEGGMGVVYKAVDVNLERTVAIKVLSPELARNPEVVERFRTEARAQANLNHTNLATLFAFLVHEGTAFIVMEFVEGENFEQLIRRRGPLPPEDAVPWFKQALLGIGAAHRMGIIHRDLKPTNLMLNRQGIVKVMDFGIAKVVGVRGATRTGMQLGTPAYMSPEQIQGKPIDVRTDIYALGITLYQMLSGHVPFEEGSDFEIMRQQVTSPPPPLLRMHPYAPAIYEGVVMKAIEKDPDRRYRSVEEFGAALEHPETLAAAAGVASGSGGQRTVLDSKTGTSWSLVPAASPQSSVTPATTATSQQASTFHAVIPVNSPMAGPAVRKGWSSRNTLAVAGGVIALAVLSLVLFARKPAAPPISAGGASGGSSSPLLSPQPQVELSHTDATLPTNLPSQVQDTTQTLPRERSASKTPSPQKPKTVARASSDSGQAGAPPPQNSPQDNAPPAPSQADLDKLEQQIDQLTVRASAVNNSLESMKQQQASTGLTLRSDMASRQASMQLNLSKAQAAIGQHDLERATRYSGLADADLQVLEHFLGR